jgi:hypothetical protein
VVGAVVGAVVWATATVAERRERAQAMEATFDFTRILSAMARREHSGNG